MPWRLFFDLHVGEVLLGGAVEVHPAAGVEAEVGGIGGAEQPEAQPVGIEHPLALVGGQEALGRRVGAHHDGDVAHAGEDARARSLEGLGARRAGRVVAADGNARPAHGLGEGGSGHVAGVAVAHGVPARDELDLLPVEPERRRAPPSWRERRTRRSSGPTCPRDAFPPRESRPRSWTLRTPSTSTCGPAAFRCGALPAPPRVAQAATGCHFHTTYSFSSSS